jgi:biotin carboxylase
VFKKNTHHNWAKLPCASAPVKEMGIKTVAVYLTADKESLHAKPPMKPWCIALARFGL